MASFHECMIEYRKQLEKGRLQAAYRGLMEYIMDLRTHFRKKYPGHVVSGSIYAGFMDMTYFSFTPESLKNRGLKIAIVFVHEKFRFEVWLAGSNKQVQTRYWELFKESGWNLYHLVSTTKGADSILEHVVAENPDFHDLVTLTTQVETEALRFIEDIEGFFTEHLN